MAIAQIVNQPNSSVFQVLRILYPGINQLHIAKTTIFWVVDPAREAGLEYDTHRVFPPNF